MADDNTATQPSFTDTEHDLLSKGLKVRLSCGDCSSDSEACALVGTAPEALSSTKQPPSNAKSPCSSNEQHTAESAPQSGAKPAQEDTWPLLMVSASASEQQAACVESRAAAAQQLSDEAGTANPALPAAAARRRLFRLRHRFSSAKRYSLPPSSAFRICEGFWVA